MGVLKEPLLGFFFLNSHTYFVGMRGIYTGVRIEYEKSIFPKQGWLATWPRDLTDSQVQAASKLNVQSGFLSCSAPAGMTVQLPCMFCAYATFGGLQATSLPRDPAASPYFTIQSWAFLLNFSHTTLIWFPPKYRVSKCYITSKFVTE